MFASFNRFELQMTRQQAESTSHQGQCDDDVASLLRVPSIRRQLAKIPADTIRAELAEYGAWDDDALASHQDNLARIVWIAAGNIVDELHASTR